MSKKLYFSGDDEHCYPAKYFDKGEVVYLAVPDKSKDHFYCKANGECYLTFMDNGLRSCGEECNQYEPRNGKNGICRYRTHCYKPSNKMFIIKNGKAYSFIKENKNGTRNKT